MSLIDSHCHLDEKQFDVDRDATIERALAAGVEQMLVVGTGDGPPDYQANQQPEVGPQIVDPGASGGFTDHIGPDHG